MPPLANNWRERRTEHRFHATFVANITTRNSERKDKLQYNTKKTTQDEQHGSHH